MSHCLTYRKTFVSLRINHCLSQNNLIIVGRMIMIATRSRKGIGVGLGEGCEAVNTGGAALLNWTTSCKRIF